MLLFLDWGWYSSIHNSLKGDENMANEQYIYKVKLPSGNEYLIKDK